MQAIWIGILLVAAFFKQNLASGYYDICRSTEKCDCINIISSGNLEFQCPPASPDNEKVIIHVYASSKRMRIDCNHIKVLNDSILPNANFSIVETLEFQECPIPKNGFKDIIDNFFMYQLKSLRFTEHVIAESLTKKDFEGLTSLKTLEIKRNDLSFFDGEIFENTPDLSALIFDENELKLNVNIFKNLRNLSTLSINSNKIDHIPKQIFKELDKVKKLYLWQNHLEILNNETFEGLINLKSLELSLNRITLMENGVFDQTRNLRSVSLRRNNLRSITRRVFENCQQIELINLDENHNLTLIDDVFSNFTNLKTIKLARNAIESISGNIFQGSTKIEKITMNNNRLEKLPKHIFKNLINLKVLHLEWNQISTLDSSIFSDQAKLEYIYLQHNQLTNIDEKLIYNLENLKEIDLGNNKITRLPTLFLSRNKNLDRFIMSRNGFDFEEPTFRSDNTPFSSFSSTNLKEVDLSYNNITRYPYDLNGIASMETIKLQHNNIGEIEVKYLTTMNANKSLNIDLRYNNISQIIFPDDSHHQYKFDRYQVDVEISDNPLSCDCNAFDLARYVQEKDHPLRDYLVLNYDNIKCAGPPRLSHLPLEEVPLEELTCYLEENCTSYESCDCLYRPLDKTLIVDCSKRNLSHIPEITKTYYRNYHFDDTEVHLEDNFLERCPGELDGYQNTTRWFLSGNVIRNLSWIPDSLEILDLSDNQLERIDPQSLKLLNGSNLSKLILGNNPWKCDCEMKDFIAYLRDHILQIDIPNITCKTTRKRLVDLSDKHLCPIGNDVFLGITVIALFCLFLITSTISLYFLYQNEIRIWLYGRGYCLWLVKEEELDKNKIYDAFISFSHKDENFVVENLVSVLESGQDPFKLCIHYRDWIPGEMIQTQIINSVNDSRRTIVVLSANFLESVWGIVEFKTAHNEAMREGRARVIIIICGDINIEVLDEDLKAYLKTNTYIKWGDPWFWDKLKYALPKREGKKMLSTKHANMMQYIEDKFKLMDKQPTHSVSTPIILSPKSLEQDPLTCIA